MVQSNQNRNRIVGFFLGTFIISWGAIWLLFGSKAIPATTELQQRIGMVILLGPTLACLIFTLFHDGLPGLRNLVSKLTAWRISYPYYLFAFLIAPITTLLGIGILSFFTDEYTPAVWASEAPTNIIALGLIGGLTIGLFEELGWTGYAAPRLLPKFNIYGTGIIIGLIWGAWHFILFWETDSFTKTIPFLLLIARLFTWLPAYRILMVWLYKQTQSLLIVLFMHASLVASLAILDPILYDKDLLLYIFIRALLLWLVVLILWWTDRQRH